MYIPLQGILNKYKIQPKGVIQVGCHWAEEHEEFVSCGIERFVYIEPCKESFEKMVAKFVGTVQWAANGDENMKQQIKNGYVKLYSNGWKEIDFYKLACGSSEGEMPMYVSHQNQGQSNSFLKPHLHLEQHPDIIFDDSELVKVVTLDSLSIEKEKYSLLVIDTEGYEGEVLKGATETLKHIDIIYTEINRAQTRINNLLVEELDIMLPEFQRVETFWPAPNLTWGDCIMVRKTLLP